MASIILHDSPSYIFEAHSLPEAEAYLSASLNDQPAPEIHLSPFHNTGVRGTAMPSFHMDAGHLNSVVSDLTESSHLPSFLLESMIEFSESKFCRPSQFPLLYRYRNFSKVSQLMAKLGLLFPLAVTVLSVSVCILKHRPPELCLLKICDA